MKKSLLFALMAVLLVFSTACKRTAEGESNRWKANKKTLEQLKAQYPNFSAAFDEVLQKAEAKMQAAENAGSEDESIKMMAEANRIATPSFVTKLKGMDSKINTIEDLAAKAAQASTDHSDSDAAWSAKTSADRAIQDARSSIKSAKVTSVAAADGVVNSAIQNLERAEKRLQDVIKTSKDKKDAQDKAKEDKKVAEDEKKAAEEKKKSPIKCGYCGKMNEAGSVECASCGASLSQK